MNKQTAFYIFFFAFYLVSCNCATSNQGDNATIKNFGLETNLKNEATKDYIRIMSFNLYNRPYSRSARLNRAKEVIEKLNPDIVVLQEVSEGILVGENSAEFLAKELGYNLAYFELESFGPVFKNGLALLSRFPISSSQGTRFTVHRILDEKGYLQTIVQTPAGKLDIFNVHMWATQKEDKKMAEGEQLIEALKKAKTTIDSPLLLIGDFNEYPDSVVVSQIKKELNFATAEELLRLDYSHSCAKKWGRACNESEGTRVDYILMNKKGENNHIALINGGVFVPFMEPFPSDHCPLWVDIKLVDIQ